MRLAEIDLNLLLVLHVVLEERSVSRAARRLHVSPPAVSNSLARLREVLEDPLFLRHGRGVAPTPRALELAPELARAIAVLDQVAAPKTPLNPAEICRAFTLACADADQLCSVPRLVRLLSVRMPLASLHVVSIDRLLSAGGLEGGAADACIAPALAVAPGHHSLELYTEHAALVVRQGNPGVGKRLTASAFNRLRHVDIRVALGEAGDGHAMAEQAFQAQGLVRKVAVTVPNFFAAATIAAESDLAAGIPRRLAEAFAPALGLRVLQIPGIALAMPMHLVWHQRTEQDLPSRLFRGVVEEAFSAAAGDAKADASG